MKRIFSAFLAALFFATSVLAQVPIYTRPAGINQGAVAITGGTITGLSSPLPIASGGTGAITAQAATQNLGTEYTLAQWAIPFIVPGTYTMGNNGAITLGTALGTTYASAYIQIPTNGNTAASPSSPTWYYVTFSTATAGTIFNNTYTNGVPTIPGSPTAFVTTGVGSVTGLLTEQLSVGIQIPASSFGANGAALVEMYLAATNNANAKSGKAYFHTSNAVAGTVVTSANMASLSNGGTVRLIENRGVTGAQVATPIPAIVGPEGTGIAYTSLDTTAALWINTSLTHSGAATDNIVLERGAVRIRYGL